MWGIVKRYNAGRGLAGFLALAIAVILCLKEKTSHDEMCIVAVLLPGRYCPG